ncbi:MAG TPA: hypothetical protein VHZ95_02745, partial [Polyangiales bacterium]|nr:hypothetical protein [Polyangiales bacterium]
GVYRRLDDRMAILAGGYRTALPRHQTLRATFDWSFAMLDADSQRLFRRLATFGGLFTFEAMCAVSCDAELTVGHAISNISELVAKSLVNVEFDGPVAKYRLLESTRAYASEKLQAEGEKQKIASRHARYLSTCFLTRSGEQGRSESDHSPDLQQTLDDARSAFDWAFSVDGDLRLGVELASNLVGALLESGMIEECCARASRALEAVESLPARSVDAASEMRVRAALASALPYVCGPVARSEALWRDVETLATEGGDYAFKARALWGLWNTMISSGNIDESMKYAARFEQLVHAHGTPWQQVLAGQLNAISLHCRGEHAQAKKGLLSAIQRFTRLEGEAQRCGRFAVDPLVFCNGTLARIVWLQGDHEEAMAIVDRLVNLVRPETIEPSLTHLLGATAAPLALMSGDLQLGARYLEIMRSQAAFHRFDIWRDYCDCLTGYGEFVAGRAARALPLLEASIEALLARGFRRLIAPFIVACAEALVETGRLADASRHLDDALAFCQSNGELLFLPEVWRGLALVAQAQALAHARSSHAYREKHADAIRHCRNAIDLARAQGARMWELRASMVLARLLHADGQSEDAAELLETFVVHFDPASPFLDSRALFALLGELRDRPDARPARVTFERPKRGLYSFSPLSQDLH